MADIRQLSSASQMDHDEHTTSTGKTALYVSVAQELQVQTTTTREETYYGSAPEEYWTAVLPEETQYQIDKTLRGRASQVRARVFILCFE
ncbi:unnamed protein product [Sphagnum troendelagicum]|uniref:Uncharacterized protein n=1 Tax=Sphagnum troendelagicum TaxID=128251 RepID=A0ABP0TPW1_9BRYO